MSTAVVQQSPLSHIQSFASEREPSSPVLHQTQRPQASSSGARRPIPQEITFDEGPDDVEGEYDSENEPEVENSELAQEKVFKSGYLLKKGERRKSWKKRWFVLRKSHLAYYKDEKEYKLLHIINMKSAHAIDEVRIKSHPHSFGIVTRARTYYIQADSGETLDEWLEALWSCQSANSASRRSSQRRSSQRRSSQRDNPSTALDAQIDAGRPNDMMASPEDVGTLSRPVAAPASDSAGGNAPSKAIFKNKSRSRDSLRVNAASLSATEPRDIPKKASKQYLEDGSAATSPSANSPGTQSPHSPARYFINDTPNDSTDSSEDDGEFLDHLDGDGPESGGTEAVPQGQLPEQAGSRKSDNVIAKSGYLLKRGSKYNGWKKRWFVLRNQKLAYYKNEKEYEIKGMIPLSSVLDVLDCNPAAKHKVHCFRVITPSRPLMVCAETAESAKSWVSALRAELAEVKNSTSTVYDD